jgi:hypothetical protein
MRRVRILVLAAFAVLAVAAVASATASAARPEFEKALSFELTAGAGLLESTSGSKITCTSATAKGSVSAVDKKAVTVPRVIYKGCKEGASTCQTGTTAGEITTTEIAGKLVYTDTGKTMVGVLLEPKSAGGSFAEFKCGTVAGAVFGSVIPEMLPGELNLSKTECKLIFVQLGGIQKSQQIEGVGAKHHLSAFGLIESALESTQTVHWLPVGESNKVIA